MPGARLTREDRQLIAAWLAEGLGYAEIGRRLGRPTSTVSREIARNGKPGGYRAESAQQTADRRALRRKPAGSRRRLASSPYSVPVRDFGEEFAELLAATGLPRMSARVFVFLLISDSGSLTAGELAGQLMVSPASVSKAVGLLADMNLIVRTPDPGSRRERYAVIDEVWLRAWRTDTSAHAAVAAAAQRGRDILGAHTSAGARLANMGAFFARLSGQMSGAGLADEVLQDAVAVLANLVHSIGPLAVDELAAALGWQPDRVTNALAALGRQPAVAETLASASPEPGSHAS